MVLIKAVVIVLVYRRLVPLKSHIQSTTSYRTCKGHTTLHHQLISWVGAHNQTRQAFTLQSLYSSWFHIPTGAFVPWFQPSAFSPRQRRSSSDALVRGTQSVLTVLSSQYSVVLPGVGYIAPGTISYDTHLSSCLDVPGYQIPGTGVLDSSTKKTNECQTPTQKSHQTDIPKRAMNGFRSTPQSFVRPTQPGRLVTLSRCTHARLGSSSGQRMDTKTLTNVQGWRTATWHNMTNFPVSDDGF